MFVEVCGVVVCGETWFEVHREANLQHTLIGQVSDLKQTKLSSKPKHENRLKSQEI